MRKFIDLFTLSYTKISKYLVVVAVIVILCGSCQESDMERSLKAAGQNRSQLEMVLEHYKRPEDSLKLKAAEFLIANMFGHYGHDPKGYEVYEAVFDSIQKARRPLTPANHVEAEKRIRWYEFQSLWDTLTTEIPKPIVQNNFLQDVNVITADLLIEDIDYAFKAWEFPWAKSYTFDEFCQYILPYRVADESLDSWRPLYFNELKAMTDTLQNIDDPVVVCRIVNHWLRDIADVGGLREIFNGNIKPSYSLKGKMWTICEDQTMIGICLMRSIGIAAAVMEVPHWGSRNLGHRFNGILDHQGKWQYFASGYDSPGDFKVRSHAPKIFRMNFKVDETFPNSSLLHNLPFLLNVTDVTQDIQSTKDLEVPLFQSVDVETAYLCTFDNKDWTPVYYGNVKDHKAFFANMGTQMAYLPAIIENGSIKPAGEPFYLDSLGVIQILRPNHEQKEQVTFDRKYPLFIAPDQQERCDDLIGGRFQAANKQDFSDAQDVAVITEVPYTIKVIPVRPVRAKYFRYVFPDITTDYRNGPATLVFYETENGGLVEKRGVYMNSPSITEGNMKNMFDDNDLTNIRCIRSKDSLVLAVDKFILDTTLPGDPLWCGYAYDQPVLITHVAYAPRYDKNSIYAGMHYELLYWEDNEWKLFDRKVADGSTITFKDIPANSMFWFRNLDEGTEERILQVKNGKVYWM